MTTSSVAQCCRRRQCRHWSLTLGSKLMVQSASASQRTEVQFAYPMRRYTQTTLTTWARVARGQTLHLSGGTAHGGNSASHHFDDYEEGEFNITTARTWGYRLYTVPTITGQYVKIGRMVFTTSLERAARLHTLVGIRRIRFWSDWSAASNLPFSPNSSNSERLGWSRALSDYDSLAVWNTTTI